eukprot:29098_1
MSNKSQELSVNQICYCLQPLKEMRERMELCDCCCTEYPKEDVSFYYCGTHSQCTYYQMTSRRYFVCSACFHTRDDLESTPNDFRLNKIKATIKIMKKRLKHERLRGKHLYWIRWIMYDFFIRPLNDEKLESEFVTFYESQLGSLAKEIDLKELELKGQMIPNTTRTTNVSLKRIAIEWHALMTENEVKEPEFEDACRGNLLDCPVRKRVQFIMELYKAYFLVKYAYKKEKHLDVEFVDVFMHSLDGYDVITLINDAQHCELYHLNDDTLSDCHIAATEEYDAYVCCKALLKKARDANFAVKITDSFSVYANRIHFRELNIIEIASSLHQMINHEAHRNEKPIHYNYKIRPLKWRANRTESKYNKFMNEMIEEKKDKTHTKQNEQRASMDQIYDNLQKHGASGTQCMDFWNEIQINEYDSESIVIDIMDTDNKYNDYIQSNLYHSALNQDKYFMKVLKKHFGQKMNDDDKINRFDLGQYMLKHWTYFEGDSRHISPKYASLKDETLNNNIHHIALETFNCFLDKAFIHASSTTGRRLKAMNQNAENNKHEIPVNLPMTVSHILVIMFYCNLTDLQRLYKKYGCRQLYVNEDLDELKTRNK